MKVDATLPPDLTHIANEAKTLEQRGFSGCWVGEMSRDPFLPLTLVAEHTNNIEIGTSVAIAFARNPMLLANLGRDLQDFSEGRMMLGLGTQIKPHITRRFGMEWSRPAARMQEMIGAIRAIWDCWDSGDRLDFQGDFYTHTLMTPNFSPGPGPFGNPPIFLAAVGERMLKVTGSVANGWISHAFTTPSYLGDVALPVIHGAASKAGRDKADISVVLPAFVTTGRDEREMDLAKKQTRERIAFYSSTPAYKVVLDHHGWGDIQGDLTRMSKRGEWEAMGDLIDDEMLNEFSTVAEPDQVAQKLQDRFGGLVDRLSLFITADSDALMWDKIVAEISGAESG